MTIIGEIHLPPPPAWMRGAVCATTDPEIFHPEQGGSTKEAKQICWTSCEAEVREQCLAYALKNDERYGVWGGRSERERRRIKRGEVLKPFIKPESTPDECKHCGHPYKRKRPTQRYCSKSCAKAGENARREARNRKLRHCASCGNEFESSHALYCSTECRVQARTKNVLPGSNVCDWCGEDYAPIHHKQRYCSEEHKQEARKVQWRDFHRKLRDTESVGA